MKKIKLHHLLLFTLACISNVINTMDIDKPYACDKCPKTFITQQGLDIHTTIHRTYILKPTIHNKDYLYIKPHACHRCPERFITQECFNIHTAMHNFENSAKSTINNTNHSPIAHLLTPENLNDKQFLDWAADL